MSEEMLSSIRPKIKQLIADAYDLPRPEKNARKRGRTSVCRTRMFKRVEKR